MSAGAGVRPLLALPSPERRHAVAATLAGARRPPRPRPALAVTIHDVEPATWERCALLREWLADHGVEHATLLVIPAPDLHPFDRRSPAMRDWLADRLAAGDEVAQHGFRHEQTRAGAPLRQALARWQGGRSTEFVGLDADETERALDAGRRILRSAGLAPAGFVAPGFAYTPPLHAALRDRYAWWATSAAVHGVGATSVRAPALGLGASGPIKRAGSPPLVQLAAAASRRVLRLELHPADLDHPRLVGVADRLLRRHAGRRALTCAELLAARG